MCKWKDSTIYSQVDINRVPKSFTIKYRSLSISINSNNINYPNKWIMYCFELNIEAKVLGNYDTDNIEAIKKKAIEIVKTKLKLLNDYFSVIEKSYA